MGDESTSLWLIGELQEKIYETKNRAEAAEARVAELESAMRRFADEHVRKIERIAELEAERDEWVAHAGDLANMPGEKEAFSQRDAAIARAEKAEARVAELEAKYDELMRMNKDRIEMHQRAEAKRDEAVARVEELEALGGDDG